MFKINQTVSLPEDLIKDLNSLSLTKKYKNSAIHFISVLKFNSYQKYGMYDLYVPMGFNYLSTIFTVNYKKNFLNKLMDSNIVICDNKYSKDGGKCLHYRINNKYFNNQSIYNIISYNMSLSSEAYAENSMFKEMFKSDISTLNIDSKKLYSIVDEKINKLSIKDFRINDQIEEKSFREVVQKVGNDILRYPISKQNALNKAKQLGLTLIQDKRKFFIMDADEFINSKKAMMRDCYNTSIHQLETGNYKASRNTTNRRLDTNITNMCSALVDSIAYDNDLVQIDLANSQFTILSHILGKDSAVNTKPDFIRFKEVCEGGTLYTHLQEILCLNERKQAKQLMFEVMFSARTSNPFKKKLDLLFPTVMEWIKEYKKTNGSEQFAIMLQRTESDLFIDKVYSGLKEQGTFCLTKHDSLIVRMEDVIKVHQFVSEYFQEIGLKGILTSK